MTNRIPRLWQKQEMSLAGPNEPIEMWPVPGSLPMAPQKRVLEILGQGIIHGEFIHIHGETGTGKSGLLEALTLVAENWKALCEVQNTPYRPLKVFAIEMMIYETPGELYTQRAIVDGHTYDEESELIRALREAASSVETHYPLIWLREMGRVHSSSVQGGLLNLITRGMIRLPDGQFMNGAGIAWVTDSNYNVEDTSTYTLVTLDDALSRRATINIPMNYFLPEEEVRIILNLMGEGHLPTLDHALVMKVVELGQAIRMQRNQGNVLTVAPPTLYSYFAFLRLAHALPNLSVQEVANVTLIGSASPSDRERLAGVFSEVFGLRKGRRADTLMGGDLL
ncbi:MAG TPA: hypothetical protein PLI09_11615 [Candidatus Hydrogenedentes bacterium]|nr:hypothetical protein [Candidatus Hydrogenedentota bacterium]